MTCTKVQIAGGVVFICNRGAGSRARDCAFCGVATKNYKLCDFPLRGKRAGATCSKPMCDKCATAIGENRDLCPPHTKMAREHGLDVTLLDEKQGDAGKQVALDQLEQAGAPVAPRARNKAVKPDIRFRQRTTHNGGIVSAVGDWQEFLTERAAIGEYERGMTREQSDRAALELAGARPRG